jgi:phosphoribosylanthranilate isomerase
VIDGADSSIVTVCESGLRTSDDVARAAQAGFDAVLVGETFVTSPRWSTPFAPSAPFPWPIVTDLAPWYIKICGVTTLGDANAVIEAGANALGLILDEVAATADARSSARHRRRDQGSHRAYRRLQ